MFVWVARLLCHRRGLGPSGQKRRLARVPVSPFEALNPKA